MLKLKLQYFSHLLGRALIRKGHDTGKDWRQEEKGTTEDVVAGWHNWLNGHEFDQAVGVDDGQGSLACCHPWSGMALRWNGNFLLDYAILYNNIHKERQLSTKKLMLLNYGLRKDSWESLGLARRPNQSILKKISPEYSLEGLMQKLKYFGHLMRRLDSMEKTPMLGKIEGRRRRGWQRRWLERHHRLNGHEFE